MSVNTHVRVESWASEPVTQMFASWASVQPDSVAVTHGSCCITYGQLHRRSQALARRIRAIGCGSDTVVGLCIRRSLDFVVGALAIMQAGAAYMPMDLANPAERLAFMIKDAHAPLVLTSGPTPYQLEAHTIDISEVDETERMPGTAGIRMEELSPDSLAYVIYTSGSTGFPKGVEITHGGLMNLVNWHRRQFGITPGDRASQVAGLGFDAAVWEIWPYLASGARIHIADEDVRIDPPALLSWLVSQKMDIAFVPTPLAEQLMALPWPVTTRLRFLLTGGDQLHAWPPPSLPFTVVNCYGPTEASVVTTAAVLSPKRDARNLPPIGKPIDETEVHILDSDLRPVQPGEIGELYIAGPGLARGYVGRPDLTAERFVNDPRAPRGRLFRTGDLGRWQSDGRIAFAGRIDDQVKIRGNRVEPGEITAVLNTCPGVESSMVVPQRQEKEQFLVAYVVPNDDHLSRAAIQQHLRTYLPDYMVPAIFVRVDELPLSRNGKVDRGALPFPSADNRLQDDAMIAPQTSIQQQVATIVAELLDVEAVGLTDNFFLLGGHSLMGVELLMRLREDFGVEIPLRTLFERATVRDLSEVIETLSLGQQSQPAKAA